jgi:endonuclease III
MKISSEYVKAFRSLHNKLRRDFPRPKDRDFETLPESVTELLILGILATNETYARAKQALKCLEKGMVDFNEMRVTPTVELAQMLEDFVSDPSRASSELVRTLNAVFMRFDTLELSELKERNKNELLKLFEHVPGCPEHAKAVMLQFGFDIPTMPLDDRMLDYLVSARAMPPEVDLATAKAFIERQLKAAEIGTFYWQLKKAAEADDKKRKPKGKKDSE